MNGKWETGINFKFDIVKATSIASIAHCGSARSRGWVCQYHVFGKSSLAARRCEFSSWGLMLPGKHVRRTLHYSIISIIHYSSINTSVYQMPLGIVHRREIKKEAQKGMNRLCWTREARWERKTVSPTLLIGQVSYWKEKQVLFGLLLSLSLCLSFFA